MLSHHELATLMLLGDSGEHVEPFDAEVAALRRYELAEMHPLDGTHDTVTLSPRGRELLERLRDGADTR